MYLWRVHNELKRKSFPEKEVLVLLFHLYKKWTQTQAFQFLLFSKVTPLLHSLN